MLMSCNALDQLRSVLWEQVKDVAPNGLMSSLDQMTLENKTKFIVNGMNSDYIKEWQLLYEKLLQFINGLYVRRCDIVQG